MSLKIFVRTYFVYREKDTESGVSACFTFVSKNTFQISENFLSISFLQHFINYI